MAAVGMNNLVFAQVDTETASAITYKGGVLADELESEVRTGDISYEKDESEYYGSDKKVDSANDIRGYTANLELTNIATSILTLLGLEEEVTVGTGGTAQVHYELPEGAEVPVGWGFIQVLRVHGVYSYKAYWFYKTTFAPDNMNAKTKEKNLEWNSPKVTGKGWGVNVDDTGKVRYRKFAIFDTKAAALAWLKGIAGIS